MTAVDVDALDAARESIGSGLCRLGRVWTGDFGPYEIADAVLALPEITTLLAEVRRGRALREAVEGLADELDREGVSQIFHGPHNWNAHITDRLRAALAAVDES